jgi:hypothetical protein
VRIGNPVLDITPSGAARDSNAPTILGGEVPNAQFLLVAVRNAVMLARQEKRPGVCDYGVPSRWRGLI